MPMPTLMTFQRRPLSAVALTVSGNEMADLFGVSRFTGTQGDGRTFPDKSIGVWPAATNLVDNGNATTNTTGITDTSSTTSRATTGVTKFGTTAFSVATSNLTANEGPYQAVNGGLASTQYTCSAWVWAASGSPTVRIVLYDSVTGKQGSAAVTLTTTPQRITVTATTGALSINVRCYVETDVQQNVTFRVGGWQTETGAIATPYVQTDGADATRAAARVQTPSLVGMLNATQSWIALRLRMAYANTAIPAAGVRIFHWGIDGNNQITGRFAAAGNVHRFQRNVGGVGGELSVAAGAWAADAQITLFYGWNATTKFFSQDGAALSTAADTNIPALTTQLMDIGRRNDGTGEPLASSIQWVVMGTGAGALTSAAAAWFNAVGVSGGVPNLYECPGNATLVWDGRNAVATRRG